MILLFPDPDTVRLAVTSGLVPADVTLAPAAVSTDAHGRLYVEPKAGLSRTTAKVLDRLGVKGSKRHGGESVREVGSWVELVPLVKEPGTPVVASGAAVLFELPSADDLPAVVTEMLRLGNDRQGFRWFAAGDEAEARRVLLRVIGPPYYTLLRALDRPAGSGVRAYLERAPRVWVEIGWTHPLAAQIKVAEGQFALLTPPADWRFLDDAPFQDVYDLAQFPLPAAPAAWEPAEAPEPVTVPLRLTAGNAADAAELWVLRDDPVGQLDTLVRDADERLVQRLMFAVAKTADGSPVAVLRTRPSKLPPPALPLENAVAFKPYWKLPNLFLPVGRRLHPTLRRDAVRRLLADDPDRVVWLYPNGKTGFTPESVPDAAFRSLEDWVDYVIEAEQAPLAAWIGATRFDFEHFVCADAGGPKPRPDKPDRESKAQDDEPATPAAKSDTGKPKPTRTKPAKPDATAYVPPPPEAVAPNEWKLRAKELADEFLAVDGPLDAPKRVALWPRLAEAYSRSGEAAADAAVCWLNALWEHDDPPAAWEEAWAASEYPHLDGRPVGAVDLDAKLKGHSTSVAEPRAVVAGFLAASRQDPPAAWLPARLPAIQKYLESHHEALPVRAVWLAAARLAQLAGGDVKGLADARDRLLERLLTQGMQAERDLPGFLRFAGHRDAERLQGARDKALGLHQAARDWIVRGVTTTPGRAAQHDPLLRNLPYLDLMFGFAFAQLGETDSARRLGDSAEQEMIRPVSEKPDLHNPDVTISAVVDNFLYRAFRYRVDQATAGKPHVGSLPKQLLEELDIIRQKSKPAPGSSRSGGSPHDMYWRAEYAIERMRKESRLLEPNEIPITYSSVAKYDSQFITDIYRLPQISEPMKLISEVRRLYRERKDVGEVAEPQTRVLHQALALAHRAGETFSLELLGLVPHVLAPRAIQPVKHNPEDVVTLRGEVVERAIVLAAHYGRTDLVRAVTRSFTGMIRAEPEGSRFWLVNAAAGRSLRNLRRLGMRDEVDEFLSQVQDVVLAGETIDTLRRKFTGKKNPAWDDVLVTLANLAAGWLALGHRDRAASVLDSIRGELFFTPPPLQPKEYTRVAAAYVRALGSGPAEFGFERIAILLKQMPSGRITNGLTTAPFYSRLHLNVVEEVVFALVSDEFALGPTGRKWLDDDEYLVRKRVHSDMRREKDRAGV